MRLLWLLTWLAFAASANPLIADVGESTSGLVVKRDSSRQKCGPGVVDSGSSSSSSKRSGVGFIRFDRNVSATGSSSSSALEKRMELPKRAMGAFYFREFPLLSKAIVERDTASKATLMSSAVMQVFSRLPTNKQWSTGEGGLMGCTTLYIISRKGVYATHWWESVSFAPDDVWRVPSTQTDAALFKSTVLNMLTKGGKYHPKLNGRLIEDDYIRAYLIHPTTTWKEAKGDVGYTEQWQQIRTTVGQLVPTLQDQSRWTDIPYEVVKDPKLLDNPRQPRGRNLFKYDPAHDIGGGQTQHWAMLWAEDQKEPYHQDTW